MLKLLPTEAEIAGTHITKEELGRALYKTFDTALPQDWVNAAARIGRDVRPDFVWNYDGHNIFGVPGPLTEEAARWYEQQSSSLFIN